MLGLLMAAAAVSSLATGSMQLHSTDFAPGGVIPRTLAAVECGGGNRTPALSWTGVPNGVRSFALVMHDPDAPVPGGFYHWIVYNLPAKARMLATDPGLPWSELGEASTGRQGYFGPCPPPKSKHHYVFTLYALDIERIVTRSPLTAAQLKQRIEGHVIARAALSGTASSP
jgi:Raf kinase inhibitor-like YbhB/YbcL family protein